MAETGVRNSCETPAIGELLHAPRGDNQEDDRRQQQRLHAQTQQQIPPARALEGRVQGNALMPDFQFPNARTEQSDRPFRVVSTRRMYTEFLGAAENAGARGVTEKNRLRRSGRKEAP